MKQFKVSVGMATYTVKFRKNVTIKGIICDGLCDAKKKIIWIQRRDPGDHDVMVGTLWHEMAHAIFFEMGHPDMATNESFIQEIGSNIARICRGLPEGLK